MGKSNFTVSVVIPNFNGYELLSKNLSSVVLAKKNRENKIKEIVLVDDCSNDASVSLVRKRFPEIKVIRHKVNRGFAASVNMGVRNAKGNLVVLLNTDVVPEKDFLVSTFKHFDDPLVFGVSFHEKGFGYAKGLFKDGFIIHEPGEESRFHRETFWVSGGSGIFRRDLWIKLGGFDEKLFKFYWEDLDISYRAQKRGFRVLWEPNAKVIHEHESTTSRVFSKRQLSRMQETNQLIFIWKNLTSPILFRKHITGLMKRLSKNPGYIIIILMALKKIRTILKARNREKKEDKISDEAIFAKFKNV